MNVLKKLKPAIGTMRLGSWGADMSPREVANFLTSCVDLGCKDIDLADIYGDHSVNKLIGQALAIAPELKRSCNFIAKIGVARKCAAFPARKINFYDSSDQALKTAFENTLRDLNVESVQTLMIHRFDYLTDFHALARCVGDILASGKAKNFGISNCNLSICSAIGDILPVSSNQIQLSLAHPTPVLTGDASHFSKLGLDVMAWSPLGAGTLLDAKESRVFKKAERIAKKYDVSVPEIFFAWVYKCPSTRPVTGSSKIERIKQAASARDIELTHEEWYQLLEASRARGVD